MSNSLNKVQLIWNLTKDPEIRETPNWKKVASFSVATSKQWKDTSWQKQEEVEYHNIVAWNWLADILEQYTQKWKKLYIEWSLKTRTWDDTAWVKRYKTEIVADSIILLSPNTNGSAWTSTDKSSLEEFPEDDFQKSKARATKQKQQEAISIEDIPF